MIINEKIIWNPYDIKRGVHIPSINSKVPALFGHSVNRSTSPEMRRLRQLEATKKRRISPKKLGAALI